MKKGNLKVMVSSKGSRIMEELGDTVKVYSADEWKKETERREKAEEKKEKIELPELTVDDEKTDIATAEKPKEKPKLNAKVKKGK